MDRFKFLLSIYWPTFVLIMFFFTEAFYKLFFEVFDTKILLTQITKLFFVIVAFYFIYLKSKKNTFWLIVLFLVFLVGHFSVSKGIEINSLKSFGRFFVTLVFLVLVYLYPLSHNSRRIFLQTFALIMLFNAVLIFVGFAFDINFLSTYIYRFGYNGLFVTSAASSYAYIIFFIYAYYKHKNISSWTEIIITIVILCSSLLVGTKAIYLSLFLIFTLAFAISNKLSIQVKSIFISLLLVTATSLFYYYFYLTGDFNLIREEKGLLSSILSFRNDLLIEVTLPYIKENWSILNYLFGGVSDFNTRSQLGFIDVFYFWGIIGGIFYFYVFTKFFFSFQIKLENALFVGILSLIVLLAGNFFESASIAIFILILQQIFLKGNLKQK